MRLSLLALLVAMFVSPIGAAVRLVVEVPASTPPDARVCVAGSLANVGSWAAGGLQLQRLADGSFAVELDVPADAKLEYKLTRGSWETVEKNADGSELPNRTLKGSEREVRVRVARWADAAGGARPATRPSTVVGDLRIVHVPVDEKGTTRTVRIWLPTGYDSAGEARYAVLYMQDGQNCFDEATSFSGEWRIDETLTRAIAAGELPPIIVVGIDNAGGGRIDEYTPTPDRGRGGKAEAYEQLVVERVKPAIDSAYRTRPEREHTFVGGSSLGGLVSLDLVRRHPQTFGGAMVMSPSLWWDDGALTRAVEGDAKPLASMRIWLDIGAKEGSDAAEHASSIANVKRLAAALKAAGVQHRLRVDENGEHNEAAWARRFEEALAYLLARD